MHFMRLCCRSNKRTVAVSALMNVGRALIGELREGAVCFCQPLFGYIRKHCSLHFTYARHCFINS